MFSGDFVIRKRPKPRLCENDKRSGLHFLPGVAIIHLDSEIFRRQLWKRIRLQNQLETNRKKTILS